MGEVRQSDIRLQPMSDRMIGSIPVRNLWFLMLYASDLIRELDEFPSSVEENPDEIPDLVGRLLVSTVEHRMKRNLTYGYQTRNTIQPRLRGRINVLETERRQLQRQGKISCIYDELVINTVRNRYVRSALEKISTIVGDASLARRCLSVAASMRRMGVTGDCPSRSVVSLERLGRHDAEDRKMLTLAHLAFNLAIPAEETGTHHLSRPDRDIRWVRKLFEKGVAGFYQTVLTKRGWTVTAGTILKWPVDSASEAIKQILPTMQTDIVLENIAEHRKIIIDTKFNEILTSGWYREASLRSQYLYQIYAYLRSQEVEGVPLSKTTIGLLLHPSVRKMINEYVVIQGHEIRFCTVDLAAESKEIRKQLLNAVE